jgi:hypothetical protein
VKAGRGLPSKQWRRPELIVLTRLGTEESVLNACKIAGVQGLAPNNVHGLCWTVKPSCAHCETWGSS